MPKQYEKLSYRKGTARALYVCGNLIDYCKTVQKCHSKKLFKIGE